MGGAELYCDAVSIESNMLQTELPVVCAAGSVMGGSMIAGVAGDEKKVHASAAVISTDRASNVVFRS